MRVQSADVGASQPALQNHRRGFGIDDGRIAPAFEAGGAGLGKTLRGLLRAVAFIDQHYRQL